MPGTEFSPWPCYTDEEIHAVTGVLTSNKVNYWTGSQCTEFEKEFCFWSSAKYSIAVANGTVAIDMALRALGIVFGDEVIVTPRTFIATVSAIVNAGAKPVFADVDPDSQNITADTICRVITPRTKAIICVHLAGWPCDMDAIVDIAAAHNLRIIEDCAQAHGARFRGKSVGTFGSIGTWSFCQDKIMTTCGEGGMVTTNDQELWSRMWSFKDHGKSFQAVQKKEQEPGFRWLHTTFGTNYRMTEMQAATGRIQLTRMPEWHNARTHNAKRILETALDIRSLRVPPIPDHIEHAWYKCYIFIRPKKIKAGWTRNKIIKTVSDHGVPCYSGSCPEVYLEKAFDDTEFRPKDRLAVARELGETSLMFLVHPTLLETEIDKTCSVLRDVMSDATA